MALSPSDAAKLYALVADADRHVFSLTEDLGELSPGGSATDRETTTARAREALEAVVRVVIQLVGEAKAAGLLDSNSPRPEVR